VASAILRVGLTGNIASGKSTVAGWLNEAGFEVVDADELAHACLEPGEPTHDLVVAAFGEAILAQDRRIDRGALGALVFADAEARRRLEEILHPAIREREQQLAEQLSARDERAVLVTEAALLYETGSAARYDRMIVVAAPDEVRLQRLVDEGLSEDQARARMASQMPQEEKAALADYVIDNSGTLDDLREATQRVAESLEADLVAKLAKPK
jgi:dephospho-CoA kinase